MGDEGTALVKGGNGVLGMRGGAEADGTWEIGALEGSKELSFSG